MDMDRVGTKIAGKRCRAEREGKTKESESDWYSLPFLFPIPETTLDCGSFRHPSLRAMGTGYGYCRVTGVYKLHHGKRLRLVSHYI